MQRWINEVCFLGYYSVYWRPNNYCVSFKQQTERKICENLVFIRKIDRKYGKGVLHVLWPTTKSYGKWFHWKTRYYGRNEKYTLISWMGIPNNACCKDIFECNHAINKVANSSIPIFEAICTLLFLCAISECVTFDTKFTFRIVSFCWISATILRIFPFL